MTSPPSFTQTIIALSKIGKYSLDPGCAEVGGTLSFILAHRSCSSTFDELSCVAGNGQRLQGSPGHKHPAQLANTGNVNTNDNKAQRKITLTFSNNDTDGIYILIPFISTLNAATQIATSKIYTSVYTDFTISQDAIKNGLRSNV